MRLNAWKHNGLARPEYDPQNGAGTVETRSWHGRGTVVAPNKDLKTLQDVLDRKDPDAVASAKVSPMTRGTRLPQSFSVTEEHRTFAREIGVDADREFATFQDYWIAQPGQKGVKADWNATFRNWLRRSTETNRNGHGGRNGKPSIGEIAGT